MIIVQATIFACGGMAIGLLASHKIIDGYSYSTFANAWAEIARCRSSNQIRPDFSAPSIFVPTDKESITTYRDVLPIYSKQTKTIIKRFVFSSESLQMLKKKVEAPSRVTAVAGLLWKITMTTALTSKSSSKTANCFILNFFVNLRTRSSPILYSIGNIILPCFVRSMENDDDQFPGRIKYIVKLITNSADKLNREFIENLKGEDGSKNVYEYLKELKSLQSGQYEYHTLITSLCNARLYETNFGWGKPIWISTGNIYPGNSLRGNMVYLMDTRSGDGIEAWIISREEDMHVFEHNKELLAFASLNPNPLQHDD